MQNKNTKYMLFFGSLRKNSKRGYNFDTFGKGTQKFIKDVELNGYDMHDLKYYPAICEGKGNVKCELHEVEENAAKYIEGMEIGAGYTGKDVQVELNGKNITARVYTWPQERLQKYPKVESGDWN